MSKLTKEYIIDIITKNLGKAITELNSLDKAGKNVEKTNKSMSVAGAKLHTMQESLTEGATNGSRSFQKQIKSLDGGGTGLIQLYGGLAANAFAVTAAFRALSSAADYQNQIKAAEDYGLRTGQSLLHVAQRMKEVTGSAISMSDALRHASITASAGFDSSDILELTKVAKGASLALGRNLADSLERVFKGAVKAEPELLDELGIILRLKPATEAYAEELGKTASALTTFEKQQAILNEVLRQGKEKFGGMSEELKMNPYDKLAASFMDMSKNAMSFFNVLANPIVEAFSEDIYALGAAVALFATKIVTMALPSLGNFGSSVVAGIIDPLTRSADKLRSMASSFEDVKLDRLFDNRVTPSIYKAGKAIGVAKVYTDDYVASLADLPATYNKVYASTQSHAKAMRAVSKEADFLGNSYNVSAVHTTKVIRATEDYIITQQKVAKGNIRATMSLESLTFTQKLYTIATNKAAHVTNIMSTALTSMSAAATVGGTVGIMNMWKAMKSADAAGAISTLSTLGVAFETADGKSNGLRESIAKMYASFGKYTKATGLLAGAISSLFKALPIIGQLFMAYTLLSMVLSPIAKAMGFLNEENAKAEKTMGEFSSTVDETSKKLDYFSVSQLKLSTGLDDTTKNLKVQENILKDLSSGLKQVAIDLSKANEIDTSYFNFSSGIDLEDFTDTLETMNNQLVTLGASKSEVSALFDAFKDSETIVEARLAVDAYNKKIHELRSSKAAIIEHNEEVLKLAESLNALAKDAGVTKDLLAENSTVKFADGMRQAALEAEKLGAVDLTNFVSGLDQSIKLLAGATSTTELDNLTQKLSKIQTDISDNASELRKELSARSIIQTDFNNLTEQELQNVINSTIAQGGLADVLKRKVSLEQEFNELSSKVAPLQRARLASVYEFVEQQENIVLLQKEQESSLAMIQAMANDSTASFKERLDYGSAELGIKSQLLELEREQQEISARGNTLQLETKQLEIRSRMSALLQEDAVKNAEKIRLLNEEYGLTSRTLLVYDKLASASEKAMDAKGIANYNSYIGGLKSKLESIYSSLLKGNDQWVKLQQVLDKIGVSKGVDVVQSIFREKSNTASEEVSALEASLRLWEARLTLIKESEKSMKELGPVQKSELSTSIAVLESMQDRGEAEQELLDTLIEKRDIIQSLDEVKRMADIESKAIDYAKAIEKSTIESRLKFDLLRDQTAEQAAQIQLELYLLKLGVKGVANEKQILSYLTKQNKEIQRQAKVRADEKALEKLEKEYQDTIDDIGSAFGDMFNAAWDGGREGFKKYMQDLKNTLIKTFFDMAGKMVVNFALNLSGSGGSVGQTANAAAAAEAGNLTDSISNMGSMFSSVAGTTSTLMTGLGGAMTSLGATGLGGVASATGTLIATQGVGAYLSTLAGAWSGVATGLTSFGTALTMSIPVIGWVIGAVALVGSMFGWFGDEEAPTKVHMRSGAVGSIRTKDEARKPDKFAYGESMIGAISFNIQATGKDGQLSDEEAKELVDEVFQPLIDIATAIDDALVTYAELDTAGIAQLTELTTAEISKKADKMKNMNPDQFLKERLEIILDNIGGDITELHSNFKNLEDMSKYSFTQMTSYTGALLTYADSLGEQKNIFTSLINETELMSDAFKDLQQDGEPLLATIIRVGAQLHVVNSTFSMLGWTTYDVSASGAAAADSFIKLAGGLDVLMEKVNFYLQEFYSAGERMKMSISGVVDLWGNTTLDGLFEMGDFPQTRQAYRDLMDMSDENQKIFLLDNAAGFDAIYDAMEDQAGSADNAATSMDNSTASNDAYKESLEKTKKVYEDLEKSITSLIAQIESDIKGIEKAYKKGPSLAEMAESVYADLDTSNLDDVEARLELAEEYRALVISTMEEQIAALEEQAEAVEDLKAAGQSLLDLVSDLRYDETYTTKTVSERYKDSLAEYNKLLEQAESGNIDAIERLEELAPDLLDLAKEYFGGTAGADYETLFNDITLGLTDLGETFVELSTEDILKDIEKVQKDAVSKLSDLSSWLETRMLPDISASLAAINRVLTSISSNTASSASSGASISDSVGGIDFNIGEFLNAEIMSWQAPLPVELTNLPDLVPEDTIVDDPTDDILEGGFTSVIDLLGNIANNTSSTGNGDDDGLPPGFSLFSKGGIATRASIFGEAGPEAAVPLPDGRSIPVTLESPILPTSSADIAVIMQEMKEIQQFNAGATQDLAENVDSLKEEVKDLRHTIGLPIVEAIKENSTGTAFKMR